FFAPAAGSAMPLFRSVVLMLACGAAGFAAELHTAAGKVITGDLVSITDKAVVLRAGGVDTATPVSDVLHVDLQPSGSLPSGLKYTDLQLTDGTLLHCAKLALKGDRATVTLAGSDVTATLPLAAIGYVLAGAQDADLQKEWQDKFLGKKRNQDLLVVRARGALNGLEGTLGEANDKGEIRFEFE